MFARILKCWVLPGNQRFPQRLIWIIVLVCFFAPVTGHSQDLSGRWAGRWSRVTKRGFVHQGTVRGRLQQTQPGVYRAVFAGRFAVVIPYRYRTTVYQNGNIVHSSKRLGPMSTYHMQMIQSGTSMNGSWQVGDERGRIYLRRR